MKHGRVAIISFRNAPIERRLFVWYSYVNLGKLLCHPLSKRKEIFCLCTSATW